jgi:hypothetical protein
VCRVRDLDVADGDRGGTPGDVGRQQRERRLVARGLHAPPQGMPAFEAGAGRRLPAQRAVEAPPRREDRRALRGGVLLVEQEGRHDRSLAPLAPPYLRERPSSGSLSSRAGAGARSYARLTVALRAEQPVGRGPELERLGEALDELRHGSGRCLAVEGEPGIGKTRLLSELRRQAEERGYLVLAGAAAEFERDLPFGVFVDALDAHVESHDLDVRQELLPDLAGVLPSLRRDGAESADGLADARHRAHRALRVLLDAIAAPAPLVLVLDDLHWSDAASSEVLAALLRRPTSGRVLLALGYRSGMAPAKLSAALAAPGVTIIDLGPLSMTDCS